ncbi:TolC family outer membrane protein [endosymbiont of unidentified scaly snail isolate Monju]|uniref:TolC family outer membrane protein n=1 Tax=endosymbiont of unidentified scaly snail isolate Monju TaxID=1248727 RepID=UPI0003891AF2|nr:TolC family outer membrane protein [endosymbiont of unidentified scaly snail isolate Monju]BAN69690.1 RND superfamily efflux transporter OMF subunit [endosymbiont of unidentified scaly snail isolate Monju]
MGSEMVTLNDAVREALATHPDVRVQSNELQARAQQIEQAKAGYKPRIDITAAGGWEWNDNAATRNAGYKDGRSLIRKEAGARLSQMLFDGYATDSEVARQQARYESVARRPEGVSQNVALDAIKAYLDVLRHRELLRLSEDNLQAHRRTESQIRLRYKAGIGSSVDLDQVSGRRSNAEASRLSDLVNLKDVETRYLRTVGMPAPAELQPVSGLERNLPMSLAEAMEIALAEHPTLRSAKADVKAALAQHEAARQNDYPKLDLELGSNWGDDQNGLKGTNKDLSALIRLRYNLYSGGRDRARKAQTAHLLNEAKEVRNQTYREVVESLRLAWSAYQATRSQLGSLIDYVRATTATRKAYEKQFNIGKRTLVDLLNIENELFEAKRSLVETRYDNLYAQYRILAGMGRLLGVLGAEMPQGPGRGDEELKSFGQYAAYDLKVEDFGPAIPRQQVTESAAPTTVKADITPGGEVVNRIQDWAAAWASGNVDNYFSFYSSAFKPAKGSRSAWRTARRRVIGRAHNIQVDIDDIEVSVQGDNATARFRQRYRAHNYRDVSNKVLRLRRENGRWMIVSESNR